MFRKFLVAVAAMLTALAFCLPAAAEVKTFDRISIDVPDGWHIRYDDSGLYLGSVSPSPAMVMVMIHPLGGQSFAEAALELAEAFNTVPKKDDDGDYTFSFKEPNSNLDVKIVIMQENDELKMIGFGGSHPDLDKILNSVEEK